MTSRRNNAVGPQIRAGKQATTGKTIPVLAALVLAAGLATATQYFAQEFGYPALLGFHYRQFYPPWAILIWAWHGYAQFPEAFARAWRSLAAG